METNLVKKHEQNDGSVFSPWVGPMTVQGVRGNRKFTRNPRSATFIHIQKQDNSKRRALAMQHAAIACLAEDKESVRLQSDITENRK